MWLGVVFLHAIFFQSVTCSEELQDLSTGANSSSVFYEVICSPTQMDVTLHASNDSVIYLDRLKDYQICLPEIKDGKTIFHLPLDNIYTCGTTKAINKRTGQKIYYHRIVIEGLRQKEVVLAKCVLPGEVILQDRNRRDALPQHFTEPEDVNITDYIIAEAPVPYLNVAVRQDGRVLDTTLQVQPGTPLEMVIYLDKMSSDTYGILASYLKVTDNTPNQEEVIIMNGCSIDPYIFGNFDTHDNGDSLTAKFRAFKFPETNYVLFVGTVSVCIRQCKGVPCGNNQVGYGRKKREIPPELPQDPNRVFEVEMTAFLKVEASSPQNLQKENLTENFPSPQVSKQSSAYTQQNHCSSSTLHSVIFMLAVLVNVLNL